VLRLVGFANNRCAVGPCAARPIDAISTGDPRRCAVVDWWLVNRYGPVGTGAARPIDPVHASRGFCSRRHQREEASAVVAASMERPISDLPPRTIR
jgi:hypothetical protein